MLFVKSKNVIRSFLSILYSSNIVAFFLVLLCCFSYTIPWLFGLYLGDSSYVNAWDEETYLTITTARDTLFFPGYWFSGLVTLLFQTSGVSGLWQNMLFDVVLTPLTLFLIYKTCQNYKKAPVYTAALSSIVILFSSVLVNYANPLMPLLQSWEYSSSIPLFMPGLESYISALRTPEPQLSYFLISFSVYLWSKYNKVILLFFPLFFLYHFVALAYFSFLIFLLVYFNSRKSIVVLISSIFVPILFSVFLLLLSKWLNYHYQKNLSDFISSAAIVETHKLNIPLELCIMGGLLVVGKLIHLGKAPLLFLSAIFLQVIALSNMQVISGFTISFKNFHDYVFPIYLGLFLVVFAFNWGKNKCMMLLSFSYAIIVCISFDVYVYKASKFSNESVYGTILPSDELRELLNSPECVVVIDYAYAGKFAYVNAGVPNALFSYQNRFMSHNLTNHQLAFDHRPSTMPSADVEFLRRSLNSIESNINHKPQDYGSLCTGEYRYVYPTSR